MQLSSSPYRMFPSHERPLESSGPGVELVSHEGRALPLAFAKLRAEAGGGIARVVLEQTFENPHDETLHLTYKMPLPADGAISGYEFRIGPRTIKGRVEPKALAREKFERAIAQGRAAALLEQNRADIFTQEIGNVPARATITARITIDQPLRWLPEGEWELRFPTVIGPRYVSHDDEPAITNAVAIGVATGATRARIHLEIAILDELVAGGKVASPSHAIVHVPEAGKASRYELESLAGARLDRDIVVRWPVARAEVGLSLSTARPIEGHVLDDAVGLLTIVPPSPDAKHAALPRDLIVLLDTSGSMSGAPLTQAKQVVAMLIDALGEEDRFELIEFSTQPHAWRKEPAPATRAAKKEAIAWLNALEAGGGTEMHSAIVAGLRALRPGAQRQVVLVTDGYIGGEDRIVALCHEKLPADCRLHVVGVGSAANRSLATALARAGRGSEILAGLGDDVERATMRLLARTASPILTDVEVTGPAVVELAPEHVPDVYASSPVVVGVRLAPEGGALTVRGRLAGGKRWERTVRVPSMNHGDGHQAIAALFGREHVADLEMRWTTGRGRSGIDRAIERAGTSYQIATRLTSWIAIDDVRSVDPSSGSRRITQPQELPYGTTIASFLGGPVEAAMMFGGPPGIGARAPVPQSAAAPMASPPYAPYIEAEGLKRRSATLGEAAPAKRARRSMLAVVLVVVLLLALLSAIAWLLFR